MQFNLIHNSPGSLLDLVFSNIFNVNVTSETFPLVLLDYKYRPALRIEAFVSLQPSENRNK